MVIFSVDFSNRLLRISETTNHAKMLESQEYVFKVPVILIFYGQKHQFKEVQYDQTKIQLNMTKCLKTKFLISCLTEIHTLCAKLLFSLLVL